MKLHPLSVPYRAARTVARLAWVLVIVSVSSTQFGLGVEIAGGIVLLGLAGALAYEFAYYQRFEYELTGDTFDIRSGVFSRRTREIPFRRIQNVDITRGPVVRALGVAAVALETAGGSETEADLRFVSGAEASRLQTEISRRKRGEDGAESPDADEPEELFAISGTELALLGVVSVDLRVLSGLTVVISLVAPSLARPDPLLGLALTAPFVAVGLVALSALASGFYSVTNFYGFRLGRAGDDLRYERGLIQQFSGSIPLDKVQSLVVEENVLARRLGYASLSVETAGYAPGEGDRGSQAAVPLAERDRVFALARSVEPFGDPAFERPPKRARTRYAVRYALAVLALTGVAFAVTRFTRFEFAWYLLLGLLVVVPVAAHLKWAHLGFALGEDHLVTREGFWTRTTRVVPYYRIQTVIDSQTVFQRRRHLATVVADTAGTSGLTGGDPRALDIDADRADALREELGGRLQEALTESRSRRERGRVAPEVPDDAGGPGATPG